MIIGSIVRSLSGRDKKRIYMIVDVCSNSNRVLIADGTLHKLEKPKKKNLHHVAVLATADENETSSFSSNEELSLYLDKFEKSFIENQKMNLV